MKTLRPLFLAVLVAVALIPGAAIAAPEFDDVPRDHLFSEEITWLAERGTTLGCNPPTNSMFCPEEKVTRGQMAAFVSRALGLPNGGDRTFVDDDDSVRQAMARLMKSVGMPVASFASAEAFLQSAHPTSSDCVLLDIQLPGISGLELQRQLQRAGSKTPVIFITAFDDDDNVNEASKAGAAGYFRKPFDDQALLDAIRFALSSSNG